MSLLLRLKDVMFWLNNAQRSEGKISNHYFNKGMTELQQVIVEGEKHERDKQQQKWRELDEKRGDPIG